MEKSVFTSFVLLFTLLCVSCEKSYGLEVSIGPETTISVIAGLENAVFKEQDILLKEMQARNQVRELQEFKGVFSIVFRDGKNARFSESVFPVIRPGETGEWTVSGNPTPVSPGLDGGKEVQIPVLSIGDDGYWRLDGHPTQFSAEEYQKFVREEGNETLNVKGFLSFKDQLYIYLSDDSIHKYSVIKEGFYIVPDYWMEYLVAKEKMVEAAIEESDGDYAAFVFLTDTHWEKNFKRSPALIRHITEFTPVSDVFFGGDVITESFGDKYRAIQLGKDFQASFAYLGPRFFCLYGNHDNNSDRQSGKPETHLTEEQVIDFLQSQMTELDRKDGYCFYFDDPVSKTRYIGLDTGRYYYNVFRTTTLSTAAFLIDSLESVPEGWHVVALSHIWLLYRVVDGVPSGVFNAYYNAFLKVIDDFNARKKGTFTYNKQTLEYDFTDARAETLFCIGGHTHNDKILVTGGGEPVIIIGADSMKRNDISSIQETVNEQHFAVVVLDYTHRKIKLFFIGDGEDQVLDMLDAG